MSIFKEQINQKIKDQINYRQDSMFSRDVKYLNYINNRTSWIRMSSGVDIDDRPDLAKEYVLQSGVLNTNNSPKSGVGKDFNNSYALQTASPYNVNYRLGLSPIPGITSMEINNKGAYGSLRECNVNFVCWDIRQLEDLEMLFMRPGFTVLIEWGWSTYIDSKGKMQVNNKYYDFFNTSNNKKTLNDIHKELYNKSLETEGNYDYMIGYIKNYGWSFRQDGGYDCKVSVISFGEVVESLKINYSPLYNVSIYDTGYVFDMVTEGISDYSKKLEEHYQKNILAGVIFELYSKYYEYCEKKKEYGSNSIKDKSGEELHFFAKSIDFKKDEFNTIFSKTSFLNIYITLESFLKVLNKYVIVSDNEKNEPFIELSTKNRSYINKDKENLKCLAHPLQLSVDPSICLINSPFWENGVSINVEVPKDASPEFDEQFQQYRIPATTQNADQIKTDVKGALNVLVGAIENDKPDTANRVITGIFNKYTSLKYDVLKELLFQYENDIVKYNATDFYRPFYTYAGTKQWASFLSLKSYINRWLPKYDFEKNIKNLFSGNPDYVNAVSLINNGNGIGLISKKQISEKKKTELDDNAKKINEASKKSLGFLSELKQKYIETSNINEIKYGNIGNIYVNLGILYQLSISSELQNTDRKEKNEINVYEYLKNVMRKIQESTCNINNFDIYADDRGKSVHIIDINYVNEEDPVKVYDELLPIEIQGLRTTARNVSLESKIFQEQSSIVAISAQNGGGNIGIDNNTLVGWNKNISDRIVKEKNAPITKNSSNKVLDIVNSININLSNLSKFLIEFEEDTKASLNYSNIFIKISVYDIAKSSEYKNALRDLINTIKSISTDLNQYSSIIPTKLSITLDGVGGLIIGDMFKLRDDVLPRGYQSVDSRKVAYILNGINQVIKPNDWTTTLNSQFVIFDEPTQKNEFNFNLISINENIKQSELNISIPSANLSNISKVSPNSYIKQSVEPILNSNPNISRGAKILMQAQTQQEGYRPGNVTFDQNNPGALNMNGIYKQFGASNGRNGYAKFPTLKQGIDAQYLALKRIKEGLNASFPLKGNTPLYTESDAGKGFVNIYAPKDDKRQVPPNNPKAYANLIIGVFKAKGISITYNTTINDIFNIV